MPSQHAEPALTVRVPHTLRTDTRTALEGREMRAFVIACLTALVADPHRFLTVLEPHWPDPKPRGRPRL